MLPDLGLAGGVIVGVVAVEEVFEEKADVFEARVHALAVERDHGVSGVADDDARVAVMVRAAFDVYEGEVAVSDELGVNGFGANEVGDYAGEMGFEEIDQVVWGTCF